ncbi:hypothetical protein [Polyangium sp. 15x6]|uniref:hypothetical protein n=1 Tax=Polyangium sp. 15x6 TaxID=3042687 RepID=UPI002499CEC2|nr:hypothetical protein [Polyangium sp. 15x6]MDI3281684.1 hypothetical protein [Polyangium sp. 15x6]
MRNSIQSILFGAAVSLPLLTAGSEARATIAGANVDFHGGLQFHFIEGATPGSQINWQATAKATAYYICRVTFRPEPPHQRVMGRTGTSTANAAGQVDVVIRIAPPPPTPQMFGMCPPSQLKLRRVEYRDIHVTSNAGNHHFAGPVSRNLAF